MEDERCQRRLSFETTFRTEKELGIIKSLDPQMIWHPNFVKYGWRGTAGIRDPAYAVLWRINSCHPLRVQNMT